MNRPRGWTIFAVLPLALAGCGRQEQITSYRVPKPEVVHELNHVAGTKPPSRGAGAISRPERMLAAIVPHGSEGWFFKLSGPPEEVAAQAENFQAFIRSIKFDGTNPRWALPKDWKELPGSGMRFASIQIDAGGDKRLDLSVISLPRGEGNESEYLLANINRWRGQVQLPPIDVAHLEDEMEKVPLADATAYLVDLEGISSGGGMSGAPFASGGMGSLPPIGPAASTRTTQQAAPLLTYETPEGWRPGRSGGLRKAAFLVTDGDQQLEITVIDLDVNAGTVLDNVNRWREQVGLSPVSQSELDAQRQQLSFAGVSADYVVLEGPGKAGKPQTILGVIAKRADRLWFVKLLGDAPLAAREKARFEEFVKSVKFNAEDARNGQ